MYFISSPFIILFSSPICILNSLFSSLTEKKVKKPFNSFSFSSVVLRKISAPGLKLFKKLSHVISYEIIGNEISEIVRYHEKTLLIILRKVVPPYSNPNPMAQVKKERITSDLEISDNII